MCGITGYCSDDPRARAALPAMTAALAHRGPDADGFHFDGPVGLGHRRLSVIDIAGQPAAARVRRRRDRRRVQRRDLQFPRAAARARARPGTCFARNGDGEVLVHGWKAWGRAHARPARRHVRVRAVGPRPARALSRARSSRRQAALLRVARRRARVRLGAEGAAPVSRARRTRSISTRSRCISSASTSRRRAASIAAIRKLPAGHWLSVRDGDAHDRRILAAVLRAEARRSRNRSPSSSSTRALRARSSRCWSPTCRSARSSAAASIRASIAALATRISGRALDTFNLGFTRPDVGSEHEEAARVARHIGSRHHCLMLAPERRAARARPLGRRVRRAVRRPGGAADDAARAVRAARGDRRADRRRRRRGLRRLLELLEAPARGAPDPRARRARLAVPVARPPAAAAPRARPRSSRRRSSRARAATRRSRTSSTRCCAASISPPAFAAAARARIADRAEAFYDECDSPDYLDHLLDIDARLWLPDDLLAKVDRATMAFSLEARVPYLDHAFYGWCARLDPVAQGARRRAQAAPEVARRCATCRATSSIAKSRAS